jgi:high-affinity Fe2+/Pb2+ permease
VDGAHQLAFSRERYFANAGETPLQHRRLQPCFSSRNDQGGLELWIAAGTLTAIGALTVSAWLVFKSGRRIPVKQILSVAVILLMVLSVAFVGNGVRAFQEIGLVPLTVIHALPCNLTLA